MTNQNKLIVGAVVLLGAYYLYSKNKTKSEISDLKEGASEPLGGGDRTILEPMTSVPLAPNLRADSIRLADDVGKKFSNFDGKRGNSYFETIF